MVACLLVTFAAMAQTFTQQVQQHRGGEGTVTIHHDADIDRLVNAAPAATTHATAPTKSSAKATASTKSSASTAKAATSTRSSASTAKTTTSTRSSASTAKSTAPAKASSSASVSSRTSSTSKSDKSKATSNSKVSKKTDKSKTENTKKPQDDTTKTNPLADTTRQTGKPASEPSGYPATPVTGTSVPTPVENDTTTIPIGPRHGFKTTGYRVQAFAGGNTRRDRQKAEHTGNVMRQLFPGEDVYVRFYSPRWVCRVGNYLTYEEAHEKMIAIRKLGYESATIVKGKIIVYTNP